MVTRIASASLHGVDAYRVDVEVDVAGGLPQYTVVGLPTPTVREGQSRVRAALRAVGQELPPRRITVNLAPADRRKDGAAFDLPVALGILAATRTIDVAPLAELLVVGELGLDGSLRPVRGVLAIAALAREAGLAGVLVPTANAAEANAVEGVAVHVAAHLGDVLAALRQGAAPPTTSLVAAAPAELTPGGDFADVRGQALARRAIELAVAGGHNILLIGPPGIGKTMLARRVPGILPPMTRSEAIEVTRIYSAAGLAPSAGLVGQRPFRAPHHTTSAAALVGGGSSPRPGEISLAHRGVLFLDELPEFPRQILDCLRQPLEERSITIGRAAGTVRLPASFHLVAAANPCPCGWLGADERACTCSPLAIERYRARLSGPLLDRVDLQVRVGVVQLGELRAEHDGEPSAAIRARVAAARARMQARLAPLGAQANAEMDVPTTRATCTLTPAAERVLAAICTRRPGTTARTVDRLIRVARTVADLAGTDVISADAVHEAALFRMLDAEPTAEAPPLRLVGAGSPPAPG